MKYLSFDIECCDGRHICEFGYVVQRKEKGRIHNFIDKTNIPTTIGDILKSKGVNF